MAKGYRSGGVDFDDLFDPDIMGDGPSVANARSGGAALKYAHIQYGTKRADVGYRQAGTDVSNLWAAKGTATYASRGGVPDIVADSRVIPPSGGSATAYVTYRRNGTVTWTTDAGGTDSGTWAPGGATAGDAYDIAFSYVSGGGTGTLTGADGVFRQVNADRTVSLSDFLSGGGTQVSSRGLNCQIRRRSDNAVVVNFNFTETTQLITDG